MSELFTAFELMPRTVSAPTPFSISAARMCGFLHVANADDRKAWLRCRTCRPHANPAPMGRLIKGGKR